MVIKDKEVMEIEEKGEIEGKEYELMGKIKLVIGGVEIGIVGEY